MKKCAKCKEVKPVKDFYKIKAGVNDDCLRESNCKKCSSEKNLIYSRSKKGKAIRLLNSQRLRVKKNKVHSISYSKNEFVDWLLSSSKYLKLHSEWVNSNYNKMIAPSVDRLDDYKGYSFDNIQVVTWAENKSKYHVDCMNGVNKKQSMAIVKMSLDGTELETYYSQHYASRETGISQGNICNVCRGNAKTAGGFKWKYADRK